LVVVFGRKGGVLPESVQGIMLDRKSLKCPVGLEIHTATQNNLDVNSEEKTPCRRSQSTRGIILKLIVKLRL
jgi:hypothetical protein